MRTNLAVWVLAVCGGCSAMSPRSDAGTERPTHEVNSTLLDCAAQAGPLVSIDDTVDRLNELPRPVEGACLVASLERPLQVVASIGIMSAQPATGPDSPRVFVLGPRLVFSVVPDGEGAKVLELGEWTSPVRTLKAEIGLPVTASLTRAAPFERVRYQNGTGCGLCHHDEAPRSDRPGAFDSVAYRPANDTLTPFATLERHHENCVTRDERSPRCDFFHALLDFGEVTEGSFAATVATFP